MPQPAPMNANANRIRISNRVIRASWPSFRFFVAFIALFGPTDQKGRLVERKRPRIDQEAA